MFEHQLRQLFCRILFASLKPVHGDGELGGELAERFDARCAGVGFEPADVWVGDALAREFALAEAEFETSPPDAITDRRRARVEATAVHRCRWWRWWKGCACTRRSRGREREP